MAETGCVDNESIARVTLAFNWVLGLKFGDLAATSGLCRGSGKGSATTAPDTDSEPVFPNSRLAVRHIGGMLLRDEDPADIEDELREDYPYLDDEDIEFSPLYAKAYPQVGRPRGRATAG